MRSDVLLLAVGLLGGSLAAPVNGASPRDLEDSVPQSGKTDWYTDSAGGVSSALEDRKRDKDSDWYADSAKGVVNSLDRRGKKTDWYTDSAAGVSGSLKNGKRGKNTNWYTDSAAGISGSLKNGKRGKKTDWYSDSAEGMAESLERRKKDTNWYADSAKGVADSLERRKKDTNWYADSAKGVADSLERRKRAKDSDWYADSAKGVAESLERRKKKTNWYTDSAKGIADSLERRERAHDSDWYADSAKGVAETLERREQDSDWYADSAKGVAESLDRREEDSDWYADSAEGIVDMLLDKRAMSPEEKNTYEEDLRRWIYYNMRTKPLRETSERGKAFFEFTPKPRHDEVDRWHVPAELQDRFTNSKSDAEKVSILNYYLMVTDREPKSAEELGFQPTASEPVLVEGNEVGYGYALAGQHQYHCVDFVADAVDIGKENLNDFFLKHTIHCLGLLKYLAPELTMRQPLSFLRAPANHRVMTDYPQTLDEEKAQGLH